MLTAMCIFAAVLGVLTHNVDMAAIFVTFTALTIPFHLKELYDELHNNA